jgi:hypothetical protein
MSGCNGRKMDGAWLVRDCYLHHNSDDVFNKAALVYNTSVTDHLQVCGQHSDIWQYYGGLVDNFIYFNLRIVNGTYQIWFPGGTDDATVHNVAMVNVVGSHNHGDVGTSRHHQGDHVLFWHVTWPTQSTTMSSGITSSVNGQMRASYFRTVGIEGTMTRAQIEAAVEFKDNSYATGSTVWGTNGQSVNAQFKDWTNQDFHLMTGTPLARKINYRLVAVDLDNRPRQIPTAAGAYIAPEETPIQNWQLTIDRRQPGAILRLGPNPMRGQVTIYRDVAGNVSTIYNHTGIRVRTITGNTWDGKDEAGTAVPDGVYYIRAGESILRVMVTR